MSHLLRITDNTTTVTLSSGNMYLADYVPAGTRRKDEPLYETADIGFTGGLSTMRSNIQAINRLFAQAENYVENRQGPKVYIEFDPNTSGTVYRSQLIFAEPVQLPDDVLGAGWAATSFEATLNWYREPFWEGPLTQIPLANSSSTSTTDYLTVNNRNDGSGENWVSIAAADVIGDIPSPIKLEMLNATTDATATDEIYIWHNIHSNPENFAYFIEGESSSDASSTTDATSNSGAYGAFSISSTDEARIASWTLSSSDLDDAEGGRFAITVRWPAIFPYTDTYIRFKLETTVNYNELDAGGLFLVASTTDADNDRELSMFDPLRIPPGADNQTSMADVYLSMFALRTAGSGTINVDYLQLSPISRSSGWKRFISVDVGVGIDETFYFDEIQGLIYKQDSSGNKLFEFTDYGGPILLEPNAVQRLYFNTCDNAGISAITQNWSVRLWYRPRRHNL